MLRVADSLDDSDRRGADASHDGANCGERVPLRESLSGPQACRQQLDDCSRGGGLGDIGR